MPTRKSGFFRLFILSAWLTTVSAIAQDDSPPPVDIAIKPNQGAAVKPAKENEAAPAASQIFDSDLRMQDVRPSRYRGVTPGETTKAELLERWGEPAERESESVWSWQAEKYTKVITALSEDVVGTIVLHLQDPAPPAPLAESLGLAPFRPAPIYDSQGRILGRIYPERGVMFSFDPQASPPVVVQIVLDTITAEGFVLRAQHDKDHRIRRDLADLDFAERLTPDDARVYLLKARLLAKLGRYVGANIRAQQAIELAPDNIEHRLTQAEIWADSGRRSDALAAAKEIAEQEEAPEDWKAKAHLLWGDLLMCSAGAETSKSTEHYKQAIELAGPLARDANLHRRRAAQTTVLEAHLAMAASIAAGNWENKEKMAAQWLTQAKDLAKQVVQHDSGDVETLSFLTLKKTLAAYAAGDGKFNAAPAAEALLKEGRDLIAAAEDPWQARQLKWQVGLALADAVEAERASKQLAQAHAHASAAEALLREGAVDRELTPEDRYLIGRLCFYLGVAMATGKGDHRQAQVWYEKALSRLNGAPPDRFHQETGLQGERLVSIGVTLWETGDRSRAVEVTEEGLRLMEQAIEENLLAREALVVPLENLAHMHQQLGHSDQAKRYSARISALADQGLQR